MARTCEICGDVVRKPSIAKCGHNAWLCETCSDDSPGALEQCVDCEGKHDPTMSTPFDEEWRREIAMEAGMLHGVDAYNEVMGYDVEDYDAD